MGVSAGKEDPVELDSSLTLWDDLGGVVISGSFGVDEIPLLLTLFHLNGY